MLLASSIREEVEAQSVSDILLTDLIIPYRGRHSALINKNSIGRNKNMILSCKNELFLAPHHILPEEDREQ